MNGMDPAGSLFRRFFSLRSSPWQRWYYLVPSVLVVIGVLVPLFYLTRRAFQAETSTLFDVVFTSNTALLLANTMGLGVGVLICSTIISLPLAWLTTRIDFPFRRLVTIFCVLPLAIPGYVMAYVLLSSTGTYGTLARWFGLVLPRGSGYGGALIALTLSTYPYLFLNLRTALMGMDLSLEESAQSLGAGRWEVFWRVTVPQLRPAFLAGGLLVSLHVLSDFGVVSLMRFKTFSYALYIQYTASYDRIYAAWLALILILISIGILLLEASLLKDMFFHSNDTVRKNQPVARTRKNTPRLILFGFAAMVIFSSVLLPVYTICYWMGEPSFQSLWQGFFTNSLWNSFSVSAGSSILAALLALPVAYLGVRKQTYSSQFIERVAYLGYATPRLALALAWIVFTLAVLPWLYQSFALLLIVYSLNFMAEAIGPIRSTLYQIPPTVEEAARSLGSGSLRLFRKIIFPLLKRGWGVAMALVFLSVMKDLPIALLLSPPGFQTLATRTWGFAEEAMFSSAAPYALSIVIVSSCFIGFLLREYEDPSQ